MQVIEHCSLSAKGAGNEDRIAETPHYIGIFDGVSGVRDWTHEGRTMGQWAADLAAAALAELPPEASLADFCARATERMAAFRTTRALTPTDRFATCALVLPRRRPLEIWSLGDSHFAYRTKDGAWHSWAQTKDYDEITLAFRRIVVLQELVAHGTPQTDETRAALVRLCWDAVRPALTRQMLWANHPDPSEMLGYGVLSGSAVPAHHRHVHALPDDVAEVALASDGFPYAPATAAEGTALLEELRQTDPFLTGRNRIGFVAHRGGFVQPDGRIAACYDDASYLRVSV